MKSDMKYVLFTDESRATLDGPDGWAKGWVIICDQAPVRRRRQQGGGGVMIWAGIIGDELIGPVRVPQGVKLSSATCCHECQECTRGLNSSYPTRTEFNNCFIIYLYLRTFSSKKLFVF